ncbi:MAG: amidohydrolase [Gemmatimonadetes bacterium]|nr:amidohydrolase [Gemmatimonadota bacterium]
MTATRSHGRRAARRRAAGAVPRFSAALRRRLLDLRHDLHRHPELAFEERETAARLEAELSRLKPVELKRVAGTGLVARTKGRRRGAPAVAIRGDIDALPIQEATGLPFTSEVSGVMHACGHDVHATWTVGAAALLAQEPAVGDVVILLQPELVGSGAHGARPHEARDPIVGAAALIQALQTIVARRLNPATPAVVSVTTVHAGSADNVIPERSTLSGTIRTLDAATRELVHAEVKRIVDQTARAYALEAKLTLELGPPPIVNPGQPIGWARQAVTRLFGADALVPLGFANMAAEDFAWYLEHVPGCFLRIGAREDGGDPIPAHSPRFYAADEAVFAGAAVLAETARVASAALAAQPAPAQKHVGKAVRQKRRPTRRPGGTR